jgi:LacI family transcriptional regulator
MKKDIAAELSGVKEIARRANVSIGTVDRVIHNRSGVSEKTKKVIQDIIKELDYQPNIMARRLASKKVLNFAVLIPALSDETEFWAAPLIGIEQAGNEIKQYGIKIEKYFFDLNNKKSFVALTKEILKSDVDGVLLAPSFIEESLEFTTSCEQQGIPYVLINSDLPKQDSLCYIGPELFHSGYLSAHLANYAIKDGGTVLIINISREIDNYHHLLRKEEGFRAYFNKEAKKLKIVKEDVRQTDYSSVASKMKELLAAHPDTEAIFVTNSRVGSVARYLQESAQQKLLLIGYDYLKDNVEYVKSGLIDFLICQKPQEQGYKGIMAIYLVLKVDVEKNYFMPIDIITRENYEFYRN